MRSRGQAQEQVARGQLLLGVEVGEDPFGGLGDGALDAARGAVPLDGQGPALALHPGLRQRVREQGQRAPLAGHLLHEQVHQPGLEEQARLPGRALDGGPQALLVHVPQQVHPLLEQPGEPAVGREGREPVGAQRQHHLGAGRASPRQRVEERGPLVGVEAEGDRLLDLVDDQHAVRAQPSCVGERRHRVRAGRHHPQRTPLARQGGGDPRSDQRRLAAARGPDHRERALSRQHLTTPGHLLVPPEVLVGVLDVVEQQPPVGAGRRHSAARWRQESRILPQDRLLQARQRLARVEPELFREHRPGSAQAHQRVALASRLVESAGQQCPPRLAVGIGLDQATGVRQHLPGGPGLQ